MPLKNGISRHLAYFGIRELLLLRRIQEGKKIKITSNSWVPGYQGNLLSVHLHFIFLLTEWE